MIPMFLGNIFQQFYNIADSIVAGQFLGVRALAAIGSTGSLMFFVTGWLNGLSSGFAILVAQWFGAKKYDRMRHYVAMSIYLMVAFAVSMTIGFEIANRPILHLMNYSEEIMPDVTSYMGIIYAGLIVTAAYNALAAFLRALGDSKSPLYFLIISAVINVLLDIVFIIYVGMGVEGCAYATVIAQAISAVLCLIYIVKKFPILHLKKENFTVSFQEMGKLLALGIPMALQFSITAIGTILVQAALNLLGSTVVASYSVSCKVEQLVTQPFAAMGVTMATYCAQNRGINDLDRIRKGVKAANIMSGVYAVLVYGLVYIALPYIVPLFISEQVEMVCGYARTYITICGMFFIPLGMIFIFRNALQGCGFGFMPMMGGVVELLSRGIVAFVAAHLMSYVGVCFANASAWLTAGIFLWIAYHFLMKKMVRDKKAHEERMLAEAMQ